MSIGDFGIAPHFPPTDRYLNMGNMIQSRSQHAKVVVTDERVIKGSFNMYAQRPQIVTVIADDAILAKKTLTL